MTKLNLINELRELYNGDDRDYPAFFDNAAQRKRRRWSTEIDVMQSMLYHQTRSAAVEVMKKLDFVGAGNFRLGRRGAETRIEWLFRVDSLGEVARGEHSNLISIDEKVTDSGDDTDVDTGSSLESEAALSLLSHNFYLRPEQTISLRLPADFSQTEADRLADFVKSLPFERY